MRNPKLSGFNGKMIRESICNTRQHKWLDSLAIFMSMLCALHCLVTPILVVFLPVLTTTFWVDENFHFWMLLFVIPTTSVAVFMGCKQHKDKFIPILSAFGLLFLVSVVVSETLNHSVAAPAGSSLISGSNSEGPVSAPCPHCAAKENGEILTGSTFINVLGGLLLAGAHARNFFLCRKTNCACD